MPRAKTKKTISYTGTRRKTADRRKATQPGDVFWNKVIEGFKKLLSPAFKN